MQAVLVLLAGLVAVAQGHVLVARAGLGYDGWNNFGNNLVGLGFRDGIWGNERIVSGLGDGVWGNEKVVQVNSGWGDNVWANNVHHDGVYGSRIFNSFPYGTLADRSGAITTGYAASINTPFVSRTFSAPIVSAPVFNAPLSLRTLYAPAPAIVDAPIVSAPIINAPLLSRTLIAPAPSVVYTSPFTNFLKKK